MSSLSIDDATKAEFDEQKPDGMTQDEFVGELLKIYSAVNEPIVVEPDEIAEKIKVQVASQIEIAAKRGIEEGLE